MADKKSKAEADYGPGKPKGDHCGICRHFTPPHDCSVVEGEVSASMWCKYFSRRSRASRYGKR